MTGRRALAVLVLATMSILCCAPSAFAQRTLPPVGITSHFTSTVPISTSAQSASSGMPRWVKWGLVGATVGAALFAVAGQSDVQNNHSVAGDALYGAATGFVLIGGGVAVWDWLCAGDTKSRRAHLCGG